jgi:hypothetical protein
MSKGNPDYFVFPRLGKCVPPSEIVALQLTAVGYVYHITEESVMAKKSKAKKGQTWKPWAKVWEDEGWHIEYSVIEGRVKRMGLDAETLDDARLEASHITDIPEKEILAD